MVGPSQWSTDIPGARADTHQAGDSESRHEKEAECRALLPLPGLKGFHNGLDSSSSMQTSKIWPPVRSWMATQCLSQWNHRLEYKVSRSRVPSGEEGASKSSKVNEHKKILVMSYFRLFPYFFSTIILKKNSSFCYLNMSM